MKIRQNTRLTAFGILRRGFCLSCCDDAQLGPAIRERRLDEDFPKGQKAAQRSGSEIRIHRPWIDRVPEANPVAVRRAAQVDSEHHQNQSDDCRELDGAEDELRLVVEVHGDQIDQYHRHGQDRDPYRRRHAIWLEVDNGGADGGLDGHADGELITIVPAQHEAQGGVDETGGEDGHRAGERHVRRHLSEGVDDAVEVEARDGVGDEG